MFIGHDDQNEIVPEQILIHYWTCGDGKFEEHYVQIKRSNRGLRIKN